MLSSAVADLHTRIDEVSFSIACQREILRELVNKKSAFQGELNAILDPISQLPLEISSDIFMHCLPITPLPDSDCLCITPDVAPMIFLNMSFVERYRSRHSIVMEHPPDQHSLP